jgi:hypothetical protein
MRKTTHGGSGMIGGVRSPMAARGHGIVVDKPKMHPPGCDISRRSGTGRTPPVSSPQKARDNV